MANNSNQNVTHVFLRHPPMRDFLLEFVPVGVWAEQVIPPLWYFIGFIGNPLSAFIWLSKRMRRNNSSAIYLGALSISDTVFLLLHLLWILHTTWGVDTYTAPIGCELFHLLFYTTQYFVAFLVFCFTFERYVAVCHPFIKEKLCTVRRAVIITISLLFLTFGLSLAQLYIWTYDEGHQICIIRAEANEGGHESFYYAWSLATDIIIYCIVPLATLVFNCLVLREICRISRSETTRQQSSMNKSASTLTLLTVSFYFVVTQMTATIVARLDTTFPSGEKVFLTDDEMREDPVWSRFFSYMNARKVIEMLCLSHYTVYFLIYCATGKKFREFAVNIFTSYFKLGCLKKVCLKSDVGEGRTSYSMVASHTGQYENTMHTNVSTSM